MKAKKGVGQKHIAELYQVRRRIHRCFTQICLSKVLDFLNKFDRILNSLRKCRQTSGKARTVIHNVGIPVKKPLVLVDKNLHNIQDFL